LEIFALSLLGFSQVGNSPIQNLELSVGSNDKVDLVWNMPENNQRQMTISWITSETNDGGSTQAGFDNIFGHLYNSLDLRNHIGWIIDTISFYKTTQWTYRICVWKQPDGESMQLVHSQLVQTIDSIQGTWCAVPLDTTIIIEEHTDYWFGVRATQEGQTGPITPIAFDKGPAVAGKGDLFMPDLAHWTAMQIGYNTMIKASLSDVTRTRLQPGEQALLSGYRIYRDGTLIKEIPYGFVTYFTDTEFTRETDVEYCVTAVYGDEESEPVCATATITDIESVNEKDGITLSPNPTSGIVRIEGAPVVEIQVYNALGQLVKTARNTNEISLKGQSGGIYLVTVTDKSGRKFVWKLVKE